jgi:AraC family transcriptional regulator
MAAAARLSPYHFARQFKAATGLPPHRYVIARRVERAKQLLQAGTDLPLAEVAAHAGPEPVLPSLQAPRRRHAGAVPDARKDRITGRKSRQETGRRRPYHSP